MRKLTYKLILTASILLAGCASVPDEAMPPSAPIVVNKAVPVPCLDRMPEAPVIHSDAELLGLPDDKFVTAIHGDRLELRAYKATLEAVLKACVSASPSPSPSP